MRRRRAIDAPSWIPPERFFTEVMTWLTAFLESHPLSYGERLVLVRLSEALADAIQAAALDELADRDDEMAQKGP